jgi:hypothetical protein
VEAAAVAAVTAVAEAAAVAVAAVAEAAAEAVAAEAAAAVEDTKKPNHFIKHSSKRTIFAS